MAKRLDKYKERQQKVSMFGKTLVRRSKSCCELCSESGVKLQVFEVPPTYEEPELDSCILICDTCREQLENPKRIDASHWRCLNNAVWSEIPAVQVASVRILRQLAQKYDWADDLLEQAFLDPEVEQWCNQ